MLSRLLGSRVKVRACLVGLSIIIFASCLVTGVSASLGDNGSTGTVAVHAQWVETIDLWESKGNPGKPQVFYVRTNASAHLHVLNATRFSSYLSTGVLPGTPRQVVNGEFSEEWTVAYLNATYHVPAINDTTGQNHHVRVYIVLANENGDNITVKYLVRLGYPPLKQVLGHVSAFAKLLALTCFALLSIRLLWASFTLRKTGTELKRAGTLQGSGMAFMFGFVAFFLGELRVWMEGEMGGFMPKLFEIQYNITGFPINYFDVFICSLLMLGSLTFLALTYVVEKKVKDRRIPVITYNQLVATALFPLVFAFHELFVFSMLYLLVAISLAAAQIITVYLQVAIKNAGVLRKRAILTLLGIIIPVSCFIIRLLGSNPFGDIFYIIVDFSDVLGLLFFWLGNIKYSEKA
jgi:hypothetical protein